MEGSETLKSDNVSPEKLSSYKMSSFTRMPLRHNFQKQSNQIIFLILFNDRGGRKMEFGTHITDIVLSSDCHSAV